MKSYFENTKNTTTWVYHRSIIHQAFQKWKSKKIEDVKLEGKSLKLKIIDQKRKSNGEKKEFKDTFKYNFLIKFDIRKILRQILVTKSCIRLDTNIFHHLFD